MKKVFLLIIVTFLALNVFSQNNDAEIENIKKTILTAYVDGLQNEGDIEKIDKGFHPDFELLGIGKENEMWKLSIKDWKNKVNKQKKDGEYPKEGDNKISIKFLFVDVTGTAAIAKFEFYIGDDLTYVDYQSLYKFKEGWKIVSKIYYKF